MEFSFDQIYELFELSSPSLFQDDVILQNDLLMVSPPQNTSLSKPIKGKKRKSSMAFESNGDDNEEEHKKKNIIERQRRQDMSSLLQSLRLLLPIESLKGKRSVADHLHETVGYIRKIQERIEDLKEKRNNLQKGTQSRSVSAATECSQSCSRQTNLTVKTTMAGVEVSVNTAFSNEIKLSGVLNILIKEGLSVLCCISTEVDGRLLATIESEVDEGGSIDSAELQQKLTDYCNRHWQTGRAT